MTTDDLGARISRLVLGTMTFGAQTDEATAADMVAASIDAGITMVDTANVYAGGSSEEIVGRVLGRHRDRILLATKVGMPSDDAAGAPPLSATAVAGCVEASLRRLRTDRIDVLYLHQPDRTTRIEETLEALGKLVAAGTVGHIGVSNYASWQIGELQAAASVAGLPKVEVSQPLYNLLARRIEQEYVEYSTAAGLINIVYNPLGGGLLTGKHHLDQDADHSSRFGAGNPLSAMYRERYWNSRLFDAVSTLQAAASDCGLTLIETALRWLVSRESVAAVIVGASRMDHLMANIKAVEGPPLPQEILDVCDRVWSELDGPAPAYNR